MPETTILDIVALCRNVDQMALKVYATLGRACDDKELSKFWNRMCKEESEHVLFWRRSEEICVGLEATDLFRDPDKVAEELRGSLAKCDGMRGLNKEGLDVPDAFTLSYRLEFYLLHPAFAMLFEMLRQATGQTCPADTYEAHIDAFVEMLAKHGGTPQLELLGETLRRLWIDNKRLVVESTHDHLTGILNRRGFFAISVQLANLAQRTNSMMAIMMIDLDHFKAINDRFGHQAGDNVLRGVAKRLSETFRDSDLVARYGGEEFIIMFASIGENAVESLAEELRRTIEETPPEGIPLTISAGITYGVPGEDVRAGLQHLIQEADESLYRAKEAGRNRVVKHER